MIIPITTLVGAFLPFLVSGFVDEIHTNNIRGRILPSAPNTLAPVSGQTLGCGPSFSGGISISDNSKIDWTSDSIDFIADVMGSLDPYISNPEVRGKLYGRYNTTRLCLRLDVSNSTYSLSPITSNPQLRLNRNWWIISPIETKLQTSFWEACFVNVPSTTTHIEVRVGISQSSQQSTTFQVPVNFTTTPTCGGN